MGQNDEKPWTYCQLDNSGCCESVQTSGDMKLDSGQRGGGACHKEKFAHEVVGERVLGEVPGDGDESGARVDVEEARRRVVSDDLVLDLPERVLQTTSQNCRNDKLKSVLHFQKNPFTPPCALSSQKLDKHNKAAACPSDNSALTAVCTTSKIPSGTNDNLPQDRRRSPRSGRRGFRSRDSCGCWCCRTRR